MSKETSKEPNAVLHILSMLAAPAVAVTLVLLNQHILRQTLSAMEINLLFFILFLFDLLVSLRNRENTGKCLWLFSTLGTALVAGAANLSELSSRYGTVLVGVWAFLSFATAVYFVVLCIRTARWSQEGWEEHQAEVRETRRQILEEDRAARQQAKKVDAEIKTTRAAYKKKLSDDRRQEQAERRRTRHTLWQEWVKAHRKKAAKEAQAERSPTFKARLTLVFIFAAVFIFYIALPGLATKERLQDIKYFTDDFLSGLSDNFRELITYTLFFIALIGGLSIAWRLLLRHFKNTHAKPHGESTSGASSLDALFDEYGTAFSLFIVTMSMLLTISSLSPENGGNFDISHVSKFFYNILCMILTVMVFFVAVDIVRLMLEQCTQKGSLLRTAMHLTFTLVIECLMGIILGVLSGLRLKETIRSIFSFFFPDVKTFSYNKANQVLEDTLSHEISWVEVQSFFRNTTRKKQAGEDMGGSSPGTFRKINIRRYRP